MSEEAKQVAEITNTIITASAGVFGVIVGTAISAIVTWKTKVKETQLKFVEQIFQKKINTYEELIDFIQLTRSTIFLGSGNERGYAISALSMFSNVEKQNEYRDALFSILRKSHLLNNDIYIELYYLQTMIANLSVVFIEKNESSWKEMSLLIKDDFITCADRLNDLALKFYEKEIYSVKITTNRGSYTDLQKKVRKYFEVSDYMKNQEKLLEYSR